MTIPVPPINPNDTAYPFIVDGYVSGGLTIRQYFAAMAMQGICAGSTKDWPDYSDEGIAEQAVTLADALIEALNTEAK